MVNHGSKLNGQTLCASVNTRVVGGGRNREGYLPPNTTSLFMQMLTETSRYRGNGPLVGISLQTIVSVTTHTHTEREREGYHVEY